MAFPLKRAHNRKNQADSQFVSAPLTKQCVCFLPECLACRPHDPAFRAKRQRRRNNQADLEVVPAPLAKQCISALADCRSNAQLCQGSGVLACHCLLPTCAICTASVDTQAGQAGLQVGIPLRFSMLDIPEQMHEWGRRLQRHAYGERLRTNLRGKRRLSVATMFSGSDLIKLKLFQVCRMLHLYLGIVIEKVDWKFSCDSDPLSQNWIFDYMEPALFVRDADELVSGEVFDMVSGKKCVISTCDILIASCECADNSSLNSKRTQLRTSVRNRIGKSGTCAGFLIGYLARFKPGLIVTENVPGFGLLQGIEPNNLKDLVSAFAACPQCSCTAMSQILNAAEYGDPVSRRRLVAPICLDDTSSGYQAPESATDTYARMLKDRKPEHLGVYPPSQGSSCRSLAMQPPTIRRSAMSQDGGFYGTGVC